MNLPNKITMLRILAIPLFLIILTTNIDYKEMIAAVIFIMISATDAIDGYIARKTKQITLFGKFADPLADKLLVSAALIYLIGDGVPKWIALTIIAREFIITGLRLVDHRKKIAAASVLGKIKTTSQIVAIVFVLLKLRPWDYYLLILAVAFTIWSGIDYFMKAKHIFKKQI